MTLSASELGVIGAVVFAIFMTGSTHLRVNLALYSIQTLLIASAAVAIGLSESDPALYWIAGAIVLLKVVSVPVFLNWIIARVGVLSDAGTMIRAPLAMHLSILLLGVSYLLAKQLPPVESIGHGPIGATAAISLVLTGVMLMLTRKIAVSQIIGFLVIENGIFVFAVTQTVGMPMVIEMGVLLDVLVAVMIAGLLVFRIKQSFEHIDIGQLADLKD